MGQDVVDDPQPLIRVQLLQHPLAILMPQVDVLGNKIGQPAGVAAIQHRRREIVADAAAHQLPVLSEQHVGAPYQRLAAGGMAALRLRQQLRLRLQKRLLLPQAMQPRPALALHDDTHRGVGGLDDLQNVAHRTDGVQFLLSRLRRGELTLGDGQQPPVVFHGVVQRENGNIPFRVKGHGLAGEGRQPPQRQHRHIPGDRFHICLLSPAGLGRALGKRERRRLSPLES